MSSLVNKLNRAQQLKNDEYYTQYDDVRRYMIYIKPVLHHFKRLVFPWNDDNEWSNFKKYFNQNKKSYPPAIFANDACNFNYEEGDVVLGNPPFSLMKEIVKEFNKNNIKFILFAPLAVAQDVYCNETENYRTFYSPLNVMSNLYDTPEGVIKDVNTRLISNFMDFKYYINTLSKCNHTTDSLFCKYETAYECFRKHNVYGSLNHVDTYCYKYGLKHLDGRKLNIENNFKYVKMDVLNEDEFFNRGKYHQ